MLREYQQRSIDLLYDWLKVNDGNPCVVLPTAAGKSHVIAALCKDVLHKWPDTRILMLTHVKELIEQNAEKMLLHWPDAPLGIYSASVGIKQVGMPITFAGIQSVMDKARILGHQDLVIIDECHLASHRDEGGYRLLINELKAINPDLRVIGYTATPYRMGHGLITKKPAIFNALIEPTSIEELVYKGFLSKLRSKVTSTKLDVSGVKKRGGEYVESDLQRAVDRGDLNQAIVKEVIQIAEDRRHWLFFCAGVDHAEHIAQELNRQGVPAACVTGQTPKAERERIIGMAKKGEIRALTNAVVLSTGFDWPAVDLIVMLRPTMSPGLYVQMAGRGLRLKGHTDHCLVLDYAGVVATHGPITAVNPASGSSGNGEAPTKVCAACGEICHLSAKTCPACGQVFVTSTERDFRLRDDDIMGMSYRKMKVSVWSWKKQVSYKTGIEMLCATYYGRLDQEPINEYFAVMHPPPADKIALRRLLDIATKSEARFGEYDMQSLDEIARCMTDSKPPSLIEYQKKGRYFEVKNRVWDQPAAVGP